jgi:UDP-N-acetylmuramate dehydrogenase
MEKLENSISKIPLALSKNVSLAEYTSFNIGGKAAYFFSAKRKEDVAKAVSISRKMKLPFFMLGNGSNLLVSDRGFKGLVVKQDFGKIKINGKTVSAEAGASLRHLARKAQEKGLTGLEWAAAIPGTLGGSLRGNAGSFGKSMKDVVIDVEVLDVLKSKTIVLKKKECRFNYRESIFKKSRNLIILSARLSLERGDRKKIEEKTKEYLKIKRESQPLNFPSAGSVFKNPGKRSAGELIELCQLKGKSKGGAEISEKHANFIVNKKNAKAKDVLELINLAKRKVKNKFKTELKEEIVLLGFENQKSIDNFPGNEKIK